MGQQALVHSAITEQVIGAFFEVYKELGFGFLESVYKAALIKELNSRGLEVRSEVPVKVFYKREPIAWQRVDLIVDQVVVIECKAGPLLAPHARLQLYDYLRATNLEVGLLLHFGSKAHFERVYSPNK